MPRLQAVALLLCRCLAASAYQQPVVPGLPTENPPPAIQTTQAESPTGRPSPDSTVVLRDGEAVVLRNLGQISSKKAQPGQVVKFEVIRAVSSDGVIVIPEHAMATGKVLSAEHAKLVHHGGKLNVAIESVQLANGQQAPLRAVESRKEQNFGWRDVAAATAIAATIYYLPLAPVYVLAKGEEVNLPPGTRFTAYLDGDVKADRASLEAAPPPPPSNREVATIYIYRSNQDMQSSVGQPVSCGRSIVGVFSSNQYLRFELEPGRYWLYTSYPNYKLSGDVQKNHMLVLEAEAGKTYYVQVALIRGTWKVPGPKLSIVDEAAGAEAVFNAESRAESMLPETGVAHSPALREKPKGVKD
jgi:hypothetical protein